MENNYYVGIVKHTKKVTRDSYEKLVLYKKDYNHYLDLVNDIIYTDNKTEKDYVLTETLIETNVEDFREDYAYLLLRHKERKRKTKKHFSLKRK